MPETPLSWVEYAAKGDSPWYSDSDGIDGLEQWLAAIETFGIPTYGTFSDLPAAGSTQTKTTSDGTETQRQFAAVVADGVIYRDDGSQWVEWANHFSGDHADLTNVTADQHHAKTTSGDVVHDDTQGGTSADAHHPQNHDNADHTTDYLPQANYNPESDTHDRYADSEAVSAVEGADPLSHGGDVHLNGNIFDVGEGDVTELRSLLGPGSSFGSYPAILEINDIFAYADRKWTVTADATPTSGAISNLFDRSYNSRAEFAEADLPVTVTIEPTGDYNSLRVVGTQHYWGVNIDSLTIEAYDVDTASWVTLLDTTNTQSRNIWTGEEHNKQEIRFTFDGSSGNARITSLFAYSPHGNIDQKGYHLDLDGVNPMRGHLDLNGYNVQNPGQVDGVDVSAHAADANAHHAPTTSADIVHDDTQGGTAGNPHADSASDTDLSNHEGSTTGVHGVGTASVASTDDISDIQTSGDVDHDSTAGGTRSDAHHSRYADSEARSAVEGGVNVEDLVTASATAGHVARSQGDGTLLAEALAHADLTGVSSDDHHAKTQSGDIDHDATAGGTRSDAHHSRYADSEAQSAVTGSVNVEDLVTASATAGHVARSQGDGTLLAERLAHGDLSSVNPDDHHAKTTSGDIDHDSTVGGTRSDAHHSRYTDSEAQSALDGYSVDVFGVNAFLQINTDRNAGIVNQRVPSTGDAAGDVGTATIDEYTQVYECRSGADAVYQPAIAFVASGDSTPAKTPGAAIAHRRTGSWSRGYLGLFTKGSETADGDYQLGLEVGPDQNVNVPSGQVHAEETHNRLSMEAARFDVPHDTWTNIVWDTIDNHELGGYDTSTGEWTVQQGGRYSITVRLLWTYQAADGYYVLALRVNGSNVRQNYDSVTSPAGSWVSQNEAFQISLDAGDSVFFRVLQQSGNESGIRNNRERSTMNIMRVG